MSESAPGGEITLLAPMGHSWPGPAAILPLVAGAAIAAAGSNQLGSTNRVTSKLDANSPHIKHACAAGSL